MSIYSKENRYSYTNPNKMYERIAPLGSSKDTGFSSTVNPYGAKQNVMPPFVYADNQGIPFGTILPAAITGATGYWLGKNSNQGPGTDFVGGPEHTDTGRRVVRDHLEGRKSGLYQSPLAGPAVSAWHYPEGYDEMVNAGYDSETGEEARERRDMELQARDERRNRINHRENQISALGWSY